MSYITVEDINTILLKFNSYGNILWLDCSVTGDFGVYSVENGGGSAYVSLNGLPDNLRVYYPYGDVAYVSDMVMITPRDGVNFSLGVILAEGDMVTPVKYNWLPLSNTNRIALSNDELNDKLYITSKGSVGVINGERVQHDDNGDYVTYNVLKNNTTLSTDNDDYEVYNCNLRIIPSAPHITINHSLYKGNVNRIDDLISLPNENISYTLYYNNKEVTDELYIPKDFTEDNLRLRVVTKSYDPYIGIDVYINIPVELKLLTSIEDLNNYSYGVLNTNSMLSGEINNNIHIIGGTFRMDNVAVNGEVTFENMTVTVNGRLINNDKLTIKNSTYTGRNLELLGYGLINNGRLLIDNTIISNLCGFVLNNNKLAITNSTLHIHGTLTSKNANVPYIHSENDDYNLTNNAIQYKIQGEGYNFCLIRTQNINPEQIINTNNITYNSPCFYVYDGTTYTLTGNGLIYCTIDNDTIIFKNVEVTPRV